MRLCLVPFGSSRSPFVRSTMRLSSETSKPKICSTRPTSSSNMLLLAKGPQLPSMTLSWRTFVRLLLISRSTESTLRSPNR